MGSKLGSNADDGATIDITERWLESYQLDPDRPRAQFWDERLSGFGVVVGRSRRSFVARTYVKGTRVRRYVTLGHWAPSKLRAAEAGLRDRTMTVAQARSAAIKELGAMHGGEDPAPAPAVVPAGPTFGEALALHLDRLRRKDGRPRSITSLEGEAARHLSGWTHHTGRIPLARQPDRSARSARRADDEEHPGLDFTRADAVRSLLTRALDQIEGASAPAKRGGR